MVPSGGEGRRRDLTWGQWQSKQIVSTVWESRREVKKQLQFEPYVQIEDKDRTLDLVVWRLLGAFEEVITVICVGAKADYSGLKRNVEVRKWG